MRLFLATTLAALLPAIASAGCADYDNWQEAQIAHEQGAIGLDDGINPDEPDGIACEGNRGFPGDRDARRVIEDIRQDLEERRRIAEERAQGRRDSGRLNEQPIPERDTSGLSCDSFTSQANAQSVFDTDPARYGFLDEDGDGKACEFLGSGITRPGGPQSESDRRPEGSKPFYLNTYETEGTGVAPRKGLSTANWPGTGSCPRYQHSTLRVSCD